MDTRKRKLLIVLVIALFVAIGFIQKATDPDYIKISNASKPVGGGNRNELMVQLPSQFVIASFAGFKEVIAGALWIRADTFFHEGNFQAIIPVVRLVTWLDPHNIDVYTTGAWHLDYNFVDSANEMSDKRYLPASIGLLKEGIRNNPNIWDLYFELGWTHYYKKMNDYNESLKCIEEACKHPGVDVNTGAKKIRPEYVDRMLAHAYEKTGQFDKSIEAWHVARKNLERSIVIARKDPKNYVDDSSLYICDRNLAMLYLRMGWRYGDMDKYKKGVELAKSLTKGSNPVVLKWAADGAAADYAKRAATNNPPHDALKPIDTNFEVTVKKVAPRVLLIKGKLNLIQSSEYKDLASEVFTRWYQENQKLDANNRKMWRSGCRVMWRLEDLDYKMPSLDTFDWHIDTNQTVAWDNMYLDGGSFSKKIEFNDPRDIEMYPFKAKKYKLTIWATPQEYGCPDFVQDRIGWKGEALRDKKYLDTKTVPGYRIIKKEIILDAKDII